jgi:hypothetical protein
MRCFITQETIELRMGMWELVVKMPKYENQQRPSQLSNCDKDLEFSTEDAGTPAFLATKTP